MHIDCDEDHDSQTTSTADPNFDYPNRNTASALEDQRARRPKPGVGEWKGQMTINLKRQMVGAGVALACLVWAGTAQAANITATETAQEFGVLTGSQFDVSAFIATSALESADASGAFLANSTATGSALVVLTEAGGGNSDWLELVYSGPGGRGTENITAHWRSDADPGGLPALPTGVTPMFLQETGGVQDITGLLVASATASGFAFPSNLTVQVQSDIDAVPEPASMLLLGTGIIGMGARRWRHRQRRS